MRKILYIIAGCNGAGKTTASFTILPEILNCKEFVNADEIARGLSPFQPEKVAIEAGRIMLKRVDELLEGNVNFALETTLATKSYKNKILYAQQHNFKVILLYFWLPNVNSAIERVKIRVSEGGHNIETDVIKRRYSAGIKNLFNIYLPIVDEVMVFDNINDEPELIVAKKFEQELTVLNIEKFNQLKQQLNEN
jgi:predicted ABC-type ATPase